MNEEKDYFYLLRSECGGKAVYAQQLSTLSNGNMEPTLTHRAEYAVRFRKYEDAEEFLRDKVKGCSGSISGMEFKVVKYLMNKEQLSWAVPKDYVFPEYEDLLGGRGYE